MNNVIIANKDVTLGEIRSADYLSHAFGDTPGYGQRKNHKYIARIRVGLRWRYFYSIDEYETYMKNLRKTVNREKYMKAASTVEIDNEEMDKKKEDGESTRDTVRRRYSAAKLKYENASARYEAVLKDPLASKAEKEKARKDFIAAKDDYEEMHDIYY